MGAESGTSGSASQGKMAGRKHGCPGKSPAASLPARRCAIPGKTWLAAPPVASDRTQQPDDRRISLWCRNAGTAAQGYWHAADGGPVHSSGRKKYLLPGSLLKACFCPDHQATDNGFPEPWKPDVTPPEGLIITEGYATALAVSCLHPFPVVAAISANNLKNVAVACRAQWPGCCFILAGDNDFRSQNNTGLLNVQAAAIAVNGRLAMPPGNEMSDWDEFYRHNGKAASRNAFARELFNN
ncbi:toprim domain protein [Escherichia coli 2-177-06_S3_C2]|nr:toprim domain protein [Escherichia coli 2-177-06_S3_C2]KEO06585.1 toprim domain protein [Escherichia coli 2-177-06_S3_C3]